jgi:hypothetical protein
VALVSNPHLFIHDAAMWTVPLLLCAAALRDAGRDWLPFARFALAWPAIFLIAGALDVRSGPLAWFDLYTWTFAAALWMTGRAVTPAPVVSGFSRTSTGSVRLQPDARAALP